MSQSDYTEEGILSRVTSVFPVNTDVDRAAVSCSNHGAAAFMPRPGHEVWAVAGHR